ARQTANRGAARRSNGHSGGDESAGKQCRESTNDSRALSAAAMTYVASAAVAVANLLRLILIVGGRNRD
ncbi:MAG: zinc metallopeptidase, partial [Clostridia bacterium]|nr:zinc metallopeptidase [Clostridia bacterium]